MKKKTRKILPILKKIHLALEILHYFLLTIHYFSKKTNRGFIPLSKYSINQRFHPIGQLSIACLLFHWTDAIATTTHRKFPKWGCLLFVKINAKSEDWVRYVLRRRPVETILTSIRYLH